MILQYDDNLSHLYNSPPIIIRIIMIVLRMRISKCCVLTNCYSMARQAQKKMHTLKHSEFTINRIHLFQLKLAATQTTIIMIRCGCDDFQLIIARCPRSTVDANEHSMRAHCIISNRIFHFRCFCSLSLSLWFCISVCVCVNSFLFMAS